MSPDPTPQRSLLTAELLSIGSELTVGDTRDTNAGDLARDLAARGVTVLRITALPDDLAVVTAAVRVALDRADLVVSTGGLGPTPDDLTRESIAAAIGETPAPDPGLERWLRGLYERRSLPYPEANTKQAWLVPSATPVPNDGGTAPGWWVERPDGRILVALPGPPREWRPMWDGWVVGRLEARGLGRPTATRVLRLTGIGESAIADRLGPLLDRDREPLIATYARADAVDIRISAAARAGDPVGDAAARVADAEAAVQALVGEHVWGTGTTTWAEAVAAALDTAGLRLATIEAGTRGAFATLLADGLGDRLVSARILPALGASALEGAAEAARVASGSGLALAVSARPYRGDTAVSVAIAGTAGGHRERRIVFLDGPQGRARAAIAAAAILLAHLRRGV